MNNSLQVAIDKVKEQFVKAYQARNAGKILTYILLKEYFILRTVPSWRAGHP